MIHDELKKAILEVRRKHGVKITSIDVVWLESISDESIKDIQIMGSTRRAAQEDGPGGGGGGRGG